jgi:hypothetical protein
MKLPVLLLPLVLAATHPPQTTSIVHQWLPMKVGDCWVYDSEILSGDRHHPHVETWQEADTTEAVRHVPEGIWIKRKVAFIRGAVPPRFVSNPSESNILVHENCIYFVNELNNAFREALAGHTALADVCFPLTLGTSWGDPHQGHSLWTVRGRGRKGSSDPGSVTPQSWRLEANLASGDSNYVWFQHNVGIVAKRTYHNGTYHDYRVRLVSFQPAR